MRNKLTCLAPFIVAISLHALAQASGEKNTKPADALISSSPNAKQTNKASDKSAGQASEKPSALRLGALTESEKLLDQAIAKIEPLTTFHADVRQKTELLGYTFTAEGQYAIKPDFHLLFELKVQLTNDTTGSIKEVCDGRTHWRNQKVLDTQELVKMDIKKLREVVEKPQFDKDIRDQLIRQLGFSGMAPMMKGIRESQKFDSHDEETLNGHPVYVLHGQWRDAVISQSTFRGQPLNLDRMPFVPRKSSVWIGREDGWLHKLELEGDKKVQGSVTRITFEFLNPQFDAVPDAMFAFEPPTGVRAEDQTDVMYQRLSLLLQRTQGAEKRPTGGGASESSSGDATNSKALQSPSNVPPSAKPTGTQP